MRWETSLLVGEGRSLRLLRLARVRTWTPSRAPGGKKGWCLGSQPRPAATFDLIYLGFDANGHNASFHTRRRLTEATRLVLADFVAEVNTLRITMSVPLLNRGRAVAFLVQGPGKAEVMRDVLLGPRESDAQLIAPKGVLLWMADEAAAALVGASERRSA